MDRITEIDLGTIRTIEVTLGEETLEEIKDQIKTIEVRITEVDTEKSIEVIIVKEEEVGLGKDSF